MKKFLNKALTAWETRQFDLPNFLYYFVQRNIPDLSDRRFISTKDTLLSYLKNKDLNYTHYSLATLKDNKKSDTLFILGSSQFINDIPDTIWKKLKDYDTLGFNHWIYHNFSPTFYSIELGFLGPPNDWEENTPVLTSQSFRTQRVAQQYIEAFDRKKEDYKDTIYLIHSRARRRGFHPLLTPEFFPANPKFASFVYPKPIRCPQDRPFRKDDFKDGIHYRGSLNLHLHFARLMEFKKIVLVGCEMASNINFFEYFPEAQWMNEYSEFQPKRQERLKTRYDGAYDSKNKKSVVTTILAINEFVFRPEGIELFVFNRNSLLYPEIPVYEF